MTLRLSGHFSILVWFSLCLSLFWGLRENGVVKKLQFCPQNLGVILEFKYIGRGLIETIVLEGKQGALCSM